MRDDYVVVQVASACAPMLREATAALEMLLACPPSDFSDLPTNLGPGVYLFSERGLPRYLGRTKSLSERPKQHFSTDYKQAALAFLIARRDTGRTIASYRKGAESRAELMKNPHFKAAFDTARQRIKTMQVQWVEVQDPNVQALLEVYAAKALQADFNSFATT